MKILQQFFCILTLITTTHIHSMLDLPEDLTAHMCSFLDVRTIIVLKTTCTLLHKQLDWEKAEFVCPLVQSPRVLPFLIDKLCHHVKTENTNAVLKMISLPIKNLINLPDKHDVTPLMQACSCTSDNMLSLLLKHGASLQLPHIKSTIIHHLFEHGMSAETLPNKLQALVKSHDKTIIEQIINQQDGIGCTPLHSLLSRVLSKRPVSDCPLDIQTTLNIIPILRQFSLEPFIWNHSEKLPLDMLYVHGYNIHPNSRYSLRCTQEDYDALSHALTDNLQYDLTD